ncbi:MAG: hypothetical protein ABFC18_00965 [Rikenellaceae bacterium]|jgi:hypothetical protein
MTKIPFSYNEYEETREKLIDFINSNLSLQDKDFLIAFEAGEQLSRYTEYQEYLRFPSVQWKMKNIGKLKKINPSKLRKGVEKLEVFYCSIVNSLLGIWFIILSIYAELLQYN